MGSRLIYTSGDLDSGKSHFPLLEGHRDQGILPLSTVVRVTAGRVTDNGQWNTVIGGLFTLLAFLSSQ